MIPQDAVERLYEDQHELIIRRSEKEARRASSIIVSSWDNLLAWIRSSDFPTHLFAWRSSREMIARTFERLYHFHERSMHEHAGWSWRSALSVFYASLGRDGLEQIQESSFPGFRRLRKGPSPEVLDSIVHATTRGQSARGRLVSLFQAATKERRLIDKIASGVSVGARFLETKLSIQPIMQFVKSSVERIFRTEVRRISHAMHDLVWNAAETVIDGFRRMSRRDNLVRPEHVYMDGTFYRFGEPRPSLPDAPNCRCYYTPVFRRSVVAI